MGLVSGLGAATADAVYGSIAAFGLTFVSAFLVSQQGWLRLIGGFFLCYLGVRTFFSSSPGRLSGASARGLGAAYGSTLLLTLTNPTTIISFAAVFAGLGIGGSGGNYGSAVILVIGVFLGSALWWLLLSWGVSLFKSALRCACAGLGKQSFGNDHRRPWSGRITQFGCIIRERNAWHGNRRLSRPGGKRVTNRLAGETSPYLLQHAHNPVDWYPWGPEALQKAKRKTSRFCLA